MFEFHVRGLYACLVEPLRYAVSVRAMVARFSGNVENWDAFQINPFACGLLLNDPGDEVRPIRLFFVNGLQFGRAFNLEDGA